MIAGPCTVESRDQLLTTARIVHDAGGSLLRGGAYKPRTSPYAFQGLGQEGLRLLAEAKAETGLPIVTELMDARDVEPVLEVADVIQVGARNMQNYPLLAEIGRSGRPALLKRGLSATLEELLMAAEYILKEGNPNVLLCERGIRTFETAYRYTLDLTAVPVLKELSHLPVIVDPSHAAGRRDLVLPLSLAAAAAGADGIIVEIHPDPEAGDLRRAAGALRRRSSRTTSSTSSGRPRSPARRSPPSEVRRRMQSRSSASGSWAGPSGSPRASGSAPRSAGYDPAPGVLDAALEHGAIEHRLRARPPRRSRARRPPSSPRRCARCRAPCARRSPPPAPECVVTDVGSTKRELVGEVDDPRFIGGHPLAGAETAGVEHARAGLFDGATWYLTPTPRTEGVLYDRLYRLLADLGARPAAIDPETHDRLMASVSHLPHVLANVLVAQAAGALESERLPATGPSFRDATRVAGASTAIWSDIYLSNADALVAAIDDTMARLGRSARALAGRDAPAVGAWNDARARRPPAAARGRPRGRRGGRAARLGPQPPRRRRRGRARPRPRLGQHRRHGALSRRRQHDRLDRAVDRRRRATRARPRA